MKSIVKMYCFLNILIIAPALYSSAASPKQLVRHPLSKTKLATAAQSKDSKQLTESQKNEYEGKLVSMANTDLAHLKAELAKREPSVKVVETIYSNAQKTYLNNLSSINKELGNRLTVQFIQPIVDFFILQSSHFFKAYKYKADDKSLETGIALLNQGLAYIYALNSNNCITLALNKELTKSKELIQQIHRAVHKQFVLWSVSINQEYTYESWKAFTKFWHSNLVLLKTHKLLIFQIPDYESISNAIVDRMRSATPEDHKAAQEQVRFNDSRNMVHHALALPLAEQFDILKRRIILDQFDKSMDNKTVLYFCTFKLRATRRLIDLFNEEQLKEHADLAELYKSTRTFFELNDNSPLYISMLKLSVKKIMERVSGIEFINSSIE